MKHTDFIFWTEILKKQNNNLEERIDDYIAKPHGNMLYLLKAQAIQISLTVERIANLEGVKL